MHYCRENVKRPQINEGATLLLTCLGAIDIQSGRFSLRAMRIASLFIMIAALACAKARAQSPIPHLDRQGAWTRLIVDGKPFIVIGGELHNSSASSLDYMEPIWPRLRRLNLNTVLATVSWELLEPQEGHYDFTLVDGLIEGAGKKDVNRFPRVQARDGSRVEILSPLSDENQKSDKRAFTALMQHIHKVDATKHTVIMMQIENEVGTLGQARDFSPAAEAAFKQPVPEALCRYFVSHAGQLIPEFKQVWVDAGSKASGTWEEVFGRGADEAFMAWHMARYIGEVSAAGKAEHPLPMYVNAWLVQSPGQPAGEYPSGGPVSRVIDIWRAAAPAIDFFSPDIYVSDFKGVCACYTRSGNPLFIPESNPDSSSSAGKAFYAIGQHAALGFCPFAIDSFPEDGLLNNAYAALNSLVPTITAQGGPGKMIGLLQLESETKTNVELANYGLEIEYEKDRAANPAYGLVINVGPDEFLVAGSGISIHFGARSAGPRHTRILSIDELWYDHVTHGPSNLSSGPSPAKPPTLVSGRRLNGDENGVGWHLQIPPGKPAIQRIKLYRHD